MNFRLSYLYIAISFVLIAAIPILVTFDGIKYVALIFASGAFFFLIFGDPKNFILLFIFTFCSDRWFHYPLRIQLITFSSYLLILYFLLNYNTSFFNSLKLPRALKFSSFFLIAAVLVSSFISRFASVQSVYLGYFFFQLMFTSYVIFRIIKNKDDIFKYLNYFVGVIFFSGVIVLIQIILTGKIRSVGFMGFPIMDLLVMGLIIMIFGYYILGKPSMKTHIVIFVLVSATITTQSRFAWLGLIISTIYGLILCVIKEPNITGVFKKQLGFFFASIVIVAILVFVFGFDKLIIARFSDLNGGELFKGAADGNLVSNSLESRILIWITAYKTFLANKWTGVGYLMFNYVSYAYNILPEEMYISYVMDLDAHTTYFNFLTETGIIGFSAFMFYLILIFKYSFKSINFSETEIERKISIILNVLVFFVVEHSIYSGAFTFGTNAYSMHFIFALTMANYLMLKNRNSSKEKILLKRSY